MDHCCERLSIALTCPIGGRQGGIVSDQTRECAGASWPTSMLELDPAEALLVWALRRWVLGLRENVGGHLAMVSQEFARQLDSPESDNALASFAALMRGLQEHARRRIRHHQPCCPCLGADEVWLVCLVGACQRGDLCHARALAEWMVHSDGIGDLLDAAARLARVMGHHALLIPSRGSSALVASNGPLTVH